MLETKVMEGTAHLSLCGELLIQVQHSVSGKGFQNCAAGPKLQRRW